VLSASAWSICSRQQSRGFERLDCSRAAGRPRAAPALLLLRVCYTTAMSKRLQVVVKDADLERYTRSAEAAGTSLSEWVRQALRVAERERSSGDVDAKLALIRRAAGYKTGGREVDIEEMLAEIEAGRLAEIEAGLHNPDGA
jgi:hypothetical protein